LYSVYEKSEREREILCLRTKIEHIRFKVLLFLDDEEFRSRKFLNSTSYSKVYNECLQRLVCDHFDTLKSECKDLIIKEDLDGKFNKKKDERTPVFLR